MPAAITAALPPGCAMPCCRTASSDGSSTGTAYAIASRSLSMWTRLQTERGGDRSRVDQPRHVRQPRHLVGHRAGDAEARRRDRARLDVPCAQELADHRHQAVVVERDELADLDRLRPLGDPGRRARAASWFRRCRPPAAWRSILARYRNSSSARESRLTFPAISRIFAESMSSSPHSEMPDASGGPYGARDIRSLYPTVTENHLRYLEKWGLIRPGGAHARRALLLVHRPVDDQAAGGELDRACRSR